MSNWRPPPDSPGYTLEKLNIALIVISSVTMIARLSTRAFILRSLGWDDLIASVAFTLLLVYSSMKIRCVKRPFLVFGLPNLHLMWHIAVGMGGGTHVDQVPPEQLAEFFRFQPTFSLLFFVEIAMIRFSVITFYTRLSNDRWYRWGLYALAFINFALTMIVFFIFLTECKHIPDLWDITAPNRECMTKAEERKLLWAHGITGIAIDLGLLVLPISLVCTIMKFSKKRLQVLLVFCVGILALVAGILRVAYHIMIDFATDPTYKLYRVGMWVDLEGHLGLWTACFPALQPLFHLIGEKLGIKHATDAREKGISSQAFQEDPSNNTGDTMSNSAITRGSVA